MKYVMFTQEKSGIKIPILASNVISHADIQAGKGFIATSAGFFDIKTMRTCGRSESLDLHPEKDDSLIIQLVLASNEAVLIMFQDLELNKEKLAHVLRSRSIRDAAAKADQAK